MPKLSSAANAKFVDFLFCSISLDRKTPLFLYFLTLTHISRDRGAGLKGGGAKKGHFAPKARKNLRRDGGMLHKNIFKFLKL